MVSRARGTSPVYHPAATAVRRSIGVVAGVLAALIVKLIS
jgi:hypothetical protein